MLFQLPNLTLSRALEWTNWRKQTNTFVVHYVQLTNSSTNPTGIPPNIWLIKSGCISLIISSRVVNWWPKLQSAKPTLKGNQKFSTRLGRRRGVGSALLNLSLNIRKENKLRFFERIPQSDLTAHISPLLSTPPHKFVNALLVIFWAKFKDYIPSFGDLKQVSAHR